MSSDLLVELLQALDAPQHRYTQLDRYATGRQPLAYLSPEAKIALPALNRIVSNIPGLAVTSLAERLRITGFKGADVWADWLANDLDQTSQVLHREALTFGDAYVICWARADGSPLVTVESAKQVAAIRDAATREITSAVKRWTTKTTSEAWVYLPDRLEHWRANTTGAAAPAFDLVETVDNPLGVVPVVGFRNQADILGCGRSEIDDLVPLVDGLNATLAGLAVAQEYTARPRRWATGIELVERPKLDDDGNVVMEDGEPVMETVNPIPEGARAMLSESAEAKFGQLDGANLQGYENAVNIWLGQIMAVSALPAHFVGITTENPSSADALRASEASLTARAEARQAVFGRSWERVAKLMVAVRDGADVDSVDVNVQWCDPSSRSAAADADAVTKLVSAGILSKSGALRRLGYSEDEIEQEREDTELDAQAGANPEVSIAYRKYAEMRIEDDKAKGNV
jgi:hypothetical protein